MAQAPTDSSRHFMVLGNHRPGAHFDATEEPAELFLTTTSPNLHPVQQRIALPDIFTTCSELHNFISPISALCENIAGRSAETNGDQTQHPQHLSQQISIEFDPNSPILKPFELGFIPQNEWPQQSISLWDLRKIYFTRRNGSGRRFDIKLYNALCITRFFPSAYQYVGAIWVMPALMKINSQTFAYLLGINTVQGGLFHKQGNFNRHGFKQISKQSVKDLMNSPACADVDDYCVRLYTDSFNRYSRDRGWIPS